MMKEMTCLEIAGVCKGKFSEQRKRGRKSLQVSASTPGK